MFTPNKVEALVGAIGDLDLYYTTTVPPYYAPIVVALPFHTFTAVAGRAAVPSVLVTGPAMDGTSTVPYSQWNAGGTGFCIPGTLKPGYDVSMNRMDPTTSRAIWNKYVSFLTDNPGTGKSLILAECYSTYKARSLPW